MQIWQLTSFLDTLSPFWSQSLLNSVTTKLNKFSTLREPSVNRKDLQALTLMGPTRDILVLDPLDVLHLDNRLYVLKQLHINEMSL